MPKRIWSSGLAGALTVALAVSGCGGVRRMSLADLVAHQESWVGQRIETSGEVRAFSDAGTRYYVLEDSRSNRVELQPASVVSPYLGEAVTVIGGFNVKAGIGRTLTVEDVHADTSSP